MDVRHGRGSADRGRIRLRHRRRGLGRLRAGQPPVRRSAQRACCCSRPAARTTGSGSTSRSAISSPSAIRAPTGCSRPSRRPGLNGRSLNYPRGKVIGGSSAINAMIYMRGQAADYDHWRQLGLTGWGWDDVLPYFKRARGPFPRRRATRMRSAANGGSSRRACAGRSSTPSATAAERGRHPADRRLQHRRQRGLGYFQVNQQRGRRWSAARGVPQAGAEAAEPAARDRLPGRSASMFEDAAPSACAGAQDGSARSRARRGEVILAAGAIGSPQLLELSGIGPARSVARARHRGRARTARRRREPAGPSAAAPDLQGRGRPDAERDATAR